ncbi:hypothetical protein HanXRQr2_Chr01g0027181 [Helianthus annuus]|uniref:Uncharacterized protein n=1 Tax=Helianthus annuus TaxID=4232 RepID=A0A9K3JVJ0_HELAN|nr:hypothetical protein HanXRQr2_Chr01g0027181 [Helianthus annuus]
MRMKMIRVSCYEDDANSGGSWYWWWWWWLMLTCTYTVENKIEFGNVGFELCLTYGSAHVWWYRKAKLNLEFGIYLEIMGW